MMVFKSKIKNKEELFNKIFGLIFFILIIFLLIVVGIEGINAYKEIDKCQTQLVRGLCGQISLVGCPDQAQLCYVKRASSLKH